MSSLPSLVLALTLVAASAGAATFQVNAFADAVDPNPGDGICGTYTSCSLRQAVQEANAFAGRDTILVPTGTFRLTRAGQGEDAAATGDLDVLEDLDIIGVSPSRTTISAGGVDRVFHVLGDENPELFLRGVTITQGEALTASTHLGGGVLADWGTTLRVDHCTITDNSANAGGGVWVHTQAEADIRHSTLTGNSTANLGFTNEGGAAIGAYEQSTLYLLSSTVSGNSASPGEKYAVQLDNSSWYSVTNSTITSNASGGLRSFNADALVVHSTIADNGHYGLSFGSYDGTHSLTVLNTIISGLTCYIQGPGTYTHVGNLESADNCGFDTAAGELIWTNPNLGALEWTGGPTMTRQPNAGSPAIDAAAGPPACTAADQRGVPRPEDGNGDHIRACDIGAVEAAMLIFVDTFESDTTSFWSSVTP